MAAVLNFRDASQYYITHDEIWMNSPRPTGERERRLEAFEDAISSAKTCMYCASPLTKHFDQWIKGGAGGRANFRVYECAECGWWRLIDYSDSAETSHIHTVFGEAKRYDVSALEVPLADLRRYLVRHPDDVSQVNPTRFEHLMADCLREAYAPCEVIHVGGTADGGVDIKLVLSNSDCYLVQVKRRRDLTKPETVSVVRELNGVLFREGLAKGMVITTAKSFTNAAFQETRVKGGARLRYEVKLLKFDDVVNLLGVAGAANEPRWKENFDALQFAHREGRGAKLPIPCPRPHEIMAGAISGNLYLHGNNS